MKLNRFLPISALLSFLILSATSCKKKEQEDSCSTCASSSPVEPQGFTFTKNGGAPITADSAFFIPASNIIIAYYQGATHRVNIKTSSQVTGTYSFSITTNKLTYTENTFIYNATGGSVNITANANNKMSGDFTTNGSGGGFISVNGQFKDIPKK